MFTCTPASVVYNEIDRHATRSVSNCSKVCLNHGKHVHHKICTGIAS